MADAGAFTFLDAPARHRVLISEHPIRRYMRRNIHSWLEFAINRWGLNVRDEDLLFISGHTKTSRWAVAVFQGAFQQKEGHITGDFGPFASSGISVSISNQTLPSDHYRSGPFAPSPGPSNSPLPLEDESSSPSSTRPVSPDSPTSPLSTTSPTSSTARTSAPQNQCLFIQFWKIKRRKFLLKGPIRAAAGYDELPDPDPDTQDLSISVTSEDGSALSDSQFDVVEGSAPPSENVCYINFTR